MWHNWTVLPMLQDVIDYINQLGKADSQPKLLTFFDHQGNAVGDVEASSSANTPIKMAGVPIAEHVNLNNPTIDVDPNDKGFPLFWT